MVPAGESLNMPLPAGFSLEQCGIAENMTSPLSQVFLVVKSTVPSPVPVRSRVRLQKLTPRRRKRPRLAAPSDECNTTAASSTSSPVSARRRDQTQTLNTEYTTVHD